MTGIASMAPVNATGTAASYGGYAATPTGELSLMAQRFNPFRYILTGQQPPAAQPAPEPDPTAAPGNGYAAGGIAAAAEELRSRGRGHDTILAHINPREAAILRAHGGSGRINPHTGLPEFDDGDGGDSGPTGNDSSQGTSSQGTQSSTASNQGAANAASTQTSSNDPFGGAGYGTQAAAAAASASNDPTSAGDPTAAADTAESTADDPFAGAGISAAQAASMGGAPGGGLLGRGLTAALGMALGPVGSLMGIAGQNALGLGVSPGSLAGLGLGMLGTAFGGPIGGALGSAVGQAVGGFLGAHGDTSPGPTNQASGTGPQAPLAENATTAPGLRYAQGGVIRDTSGGFMLKKLAHGSGLVTGLSSGRGDKISAAVPKGSYVVPADVVSGMGGGNTQAGGHMLKKMMPGTGQGLRFAQGGIAGDRPPVDIQISPGEFVVHPEHVAALGNGNPEAGANLLDALVSKVRQSNMQVAAGMPAPR